MKALKVLGAIALTGLAVVGLGSCEKKAAGTTKIYIGVQQMGDANTIAAKNILDALTTELNFTYDMGLLNSRDSVENLNTFNNQVNMGYDGVISMADLDIPQAEEFIETCENAGAYYVGYKSDMANAMRSEKVKNSPNFLGGTSDGELDWALRADRLFDALSKSDDRKIVLASFKSAYFPQVTVALNQFKAKVQTWNTEHPTDQFTYGTWPDGSDTWTCSFAPCPDASLASLKTQGIDAIIGTNSLAKYIMPNLDSSINLYNVGYDPTYDNQFGEDKQLRVQGASPSDHIILPLIRIINAVNGAQSIDVDKKIAVGNYVYMTSAADFAKCRASVTNFTTDHAFKDALFTAEQAKALVGAPDSKLLEMTNAWTTEYVLNRE